MKLSKETSNRMYSLVSGKDLLNLKSAIIGVLTDLTEEGFEPAEIQIFLKEVLVDYSNTEIRHLPKSI